MSLTKAGILLFIAFILGALRIWIGFCCEPEPATWVGVYKALAHVFIGGLAVLWYCERQKWQLDMFWGLVAIEIVTATLTRI